MVTREPGFYWVRFTGKQESWRTKDWFVAEWIHDTRIGWREWYWKYGGTYNMEVKRNSLEVDERRIVRDAQPIYEGLRERQKKFSIHDGTLAKYAIDRGYFRETRKKKIY